MTRMGWWMVERVAHMLEPGDRDAVLGDVAESGESVFEALRDVVGVVLRRQPGLAKAQWPWLAMLALIATLLSRVLLQLDFALGSQIRTYWRYGVHEDTGLTTGQDFLVISILALAAFAWVWTSGFVLGSLSGRAVWITGALFYLLLLNWPLMKPLITGNLNLHQVGFSWLMLQGTLPFSLQRGCFLLAGIWGASRGLRCRTLQPGQAFMLAAFVVMLTGLATWTGGWTQIAREAWSGGLWRGTVVPWYTRLVPLAIMCWPVLYMAATARRRHGPATTH